MNEQKSELLKSANFKCQKCGYYSPIGDGLEINKNHAAVLCNICNTFSPAEKEDFEKYLKEGIEWQHLESFRRFGANKVSHSLQKQGMLIKSKQGKLMARPPFGYDVVEGKLVANEDAENVRLIFQEFSEGKSMNQIAQTYSISVNGIKKILKNFSYLGKTKFAGNIVQGSHSSLISAELFNRVQSRFESKNKKREE
mgnify:FL=1